MQIISDSFVSCIALAIMSYNPPIKSKWAVMTERLDIANTFRLKATHNLSEARSASTFWWTGES